MPAVTPVKTAALTLAGSEVTVANIKDLSDEYGEYPNKCLYLSELGHNLNEWLKFGRMTVVSIWRHAEGAS